VLGSGEGAVDLSDFVDGGDYASLDVAPTDVARALVFEGGASTSAQSDGAESALLLTIA
jgi:hypothetical protein